MTSSKERIEAIREQHLREPDEPCAVCGKEQVRDIFGVQWPECVYFGDEKLCNRAEHMTRCNRCTYEATVRVAASERGIHLEGQFCKEHGDQSLSELLLKGWSNARAESLGGLPMTERGRNDGR